MELSELRIFVKVVQAGSFTRAADALHMQKSAVSRAVSQMESGLGVRLLERSTRSLSLTEVGREVYERAVGILGALDDTEQLVQRSRGVPAGVLKMTCGVEFGMLAVSRWINGYMAKYPAIRVEADFTARLVDLVHEGFDLAIRVGDLADSNLAARRLGALQYGIFASPSYVAQHSQVVHPKDLDAHAWLNFSGGRSRSGWQCQRGHESVRVGTSWRLSANNVYAVRDAVLMSLGVAPLPWILAEPEVRCGRLIQLLPDWTLPEVPVHAVFPSNKYLTPKVRSFIDHACEAFAS